MDAREALVEDDVLLAGRRFRVRDDRADGEALAPLDGLRGGGAVARRPPRGATTRDEGTSASKFCQPETAAVSISTRTTCGARVARGARLFFRDAGGATSATTSATQSGGSPIIDVSKPFQVGARFSQSSVQFVARVQVARKHGAALSSA